MDQFRANARPTAPRPDGNTIIGNHVSRTYNGVGISAEGNENTLRGNHTPLNTLGGISVTGDRNSIVGNEALSDLSISPSPLFSLGIQISGANNNLMQNTSLGHDANYQFTAGNQVAPIVIKGPTGPFSGSGPYGGSIGTDHPWANFSGL